MIRRSLAFVVALLLCGSCSPTLSTSLEGTACAIVGDEVCSLESGHPRARCGDDFQWHIIESCGSATCAVNRVGGLNRTSCLNGQGGGGDAGGTTGKPDTVTSGPDSQGKDTVYVANGYACGGWNCPDGQACIGIDACEDIGCIGCQAGQRCVAGACRDVCDNSCFSAQHCQPSATDPLGTCAAMACSAPVDATAAVATGITWLVGAAAAAACDGGQIGAGTALLAKYGWQDTYSAAAVQGGGTTVAWVKTAGGDAFAVGRRTGNCSDTGTCVLTMSRHDNLAVDQAASGPCGYRFLPGAPWVPLPVHRSFERGEVRVAAPKWTRAPGSDVAVLCGHLSAEAVQAVLSQSLGAMQQPIPSAAALKQQAVPDVDSDGDGKADAWSIAVQFKLRDTSAVGWLP